MNIAIQKPTKIQTNGIDYNAIDFDKSGMLYATGTHSVQDKEQDSIIIVDFSKRNVKYYTLPEANDETLSGQESCFVDPDGENVWFSIHSEAKGTYWKCFNLKKRNYIPVPHIENNLILSPSRRFAYDTNEHSLLDFQKFKKRKIGNKLYNTSDPHAVVFSNDEKMVNFSYMEPDSVIVKTISLSTGEICLEDYERKVIPGHDGPSWCFPVADKTNNGFFMIYSDEIIHRDSHGIIDKQISFHYDYDHPKPYLLTVRTAYLSYDNKYCLIIFDGQFVRLVDLNTGNYVDSTTLDNDLDVNHYGLAPGVVPSLDCRKLYFVSYWSLYEYDLSPLFKEVNNQQNGASATTAEPTWESW